MSFLQSPEWEEFQKSLGLKTQRVDNILIIRHDLPGGLNYLYCPRPGSVTSTWLLEAERMARGEKAIFLKIDPMSSLKSDFPQEVRLRPAPTLQPRKTVVLDLDKSEDKLLAGMREKTRYNIRLAEKKGVSVTQEGSPAAFWAMLQETAERDHFRTHGRHHYEKLLSVRSPNFSNEIFFAKYGEKIIAAALINFYTDTATYLHGASLREHREVMAPYILHWRILGEARRRGLKHYDLWGVDEKKWPGVTRFKLGFGGEIVEYPESVDILYRPMWYKVYNLARKIF